jgi:hypothetical protein
MDYVIGYGTLLSRASIARTLPAEAIAAKAFTPEVLPGFRRVFNVRPARYHSSFRLNGLPIERAAMNAEPDAGAKFNGLAFPVTEDELAALDRREASYIRIRVTAREFSRPQRAVRAFLYTVAPRSAKRTSDIRRLLPRWDDIVIARTGCLAYGNAFLDAYDRTTYLADGRTRMVDYYRARVPMFDWLTTRGASRAG